MKYCDLHCDALTASGDAQVTKARLEAGGCFLQCFAAFVEEGGFARFSSLADKFDELVKKEGYHRVLCASDLKEDAVNALLSCEGGAWDSMEELCGLYARGVRMAGFVWNTPTAAGFPNFPDYSGVCAGKISPSVREDARGLTPFGHVSAEMMAQLGIIADVSHGSDALFREIAQKKRPFVASHSNAASVHNWARNLTDEQIALIADCGGVVGLNFCADFLSDDKSEGGQRTALLAHARAILNAGGEDVLAIGSDFDGIPANAYLPEPSRMPVFLQALADEFGARVAEKAARDNFLRVFREVCGEKNAAGTQSKE